MSLKQICFSPKIILLAVALIFAGCAPTESPQPAAPASNAAPPPVSTSSKPALPPLPTGKHAAMIASPNSIKVCDGSGLGVTTLAYTIIPPVLSADVRIDSPGGPQFAATLESGFAPTGKWVADGMVFYLQDTTGGKSLTPENTLASVTVRVTQEGCP